MTRSVSTDRNHVRISGRATSRMSVLSSMMSFSGSTPAARAARAQRSTAARASPESNERRACSASSARTISAQSARNAAPARYPVSATDTVLGHGRAARTIASMRELEVIPQPPSDGPEGTAHEHEREDPFRGNTATEQQRNRGDADEDDHP